MLLTMDGFGSRNGPDKLPMNDQARQHLFSNKDLPNQNVFLDYYSRNKFPSKTFSKSKVAIDKIDRFNSTNNRAEKSVFTSIEHFPPTFPNKQKKKSSTSTDLQDFCMGMMEEGKEEHKETSKGPQDERGKSSRSRENGKSRYKTELCRPFEENGSCKYAEKCQFAHGKHELRTLVRHPKYKTDLCKTYHTTGLCPYGLRCHFIHNKHERNISQTNKLILELAEKTLMIKQQSSLFNQGLIASLLNNQQPLTDTSDQPSNPPNLQSSFSSQQLEQLFRQFFSSGAFSPQQQQQQQQQPQQQPQQQYPSQRQQTCLFLRSMHSSSPSAPSSLNDSPTTSPTNLSTQLSTHFSSQLFCNLPPNAPAMAFRGNDKMNDLFQEDLLSAKLKSIMQSAGF